MPRFLISKYFFYFSSLVPYMYIIKSIESYSISMVYGLYYFGKGVLSNVSLVQYIKFDCLAKDYLNATRMFSLKTGDKYKIFYGTFEFFKELEDKYVKIA